MSERPAPVEQPEQTEPAAPPAWDKEEARARYRKTMRGPFMRGVGVLTVVVILLAWAWGGAAAFAPNVENLPNHDFTVLPKQCIACHTAHLPGSAAPPMPHWSAPSCGFCHRQSFPARGPDAVR